VPDWERDHTWCIPFAAVNQESLVRQVDEIRLLGRGIGSRDYDRRVVGIGMGIAAPNSIDDTYALDLNHHLI